ncbi:MAG: hypothetical protein CMK92_02770 [Pseudomonas sp.]|nr:hypothetical protein [Pseudomonas sp.]
MSLTDEQIFRKEAYTMCVMHSCTEETDPYPAEGDDGALCHRHRHERLYRCDECQEKRATQSHRLCFLCHDVYDNSYNNDEDNGVDMTMHIVPVTRPRRPVTRCKGPLTKDACAVCLEKSHPTSDVSILHCGHAFHTQCIDEATRPPRKQVCPLCRADV